LSVSSAELALLFALSHHGPGDGTGAIHRKITGFLCKPSAVAGAVDITSYGGSRAHRMNTSLPAPTA